MEVFGVLFSVHQFVLPDAKFQQKFKHLFEFPVFYRFSIVLLAFFIKTAAALIKSLSTIGLFYQIVHLSMAFISMFDIVDHSIQQGNPRYYAPV